MSFRKAQTFVEYMLLLTVVATIMIVMSTMVKRGAQSVVKTVADQLGNQQASESSDPEGSHLENMISRYETDRRIRKFEEMGGAGEEYLRDRTAGDILQITNMGLSER
ncbi:MAG: hypothetical protein ACLFPX_07145 [Candidatus Omnitrophota bacterium]